MHKQDFVHVRALIEEICEKNRIINELKALLSKAHSSYDSLTKEISHERSERRILQSECDDHLEAVQRQRRILQSDCDSYLRALGKCREDIKQHVTTIQDLRKENLELRAGPTPSNEEVIALIREQLSIFNSATFPKIAAIKAVKELQHCGLKEAKDLVESMPEFQVKDLYQYNTTSVIGLSDSNNSKS